MTATVQPILPLAEKDEQAERATMEQAMTLAEAEQRSRDFLAQLEAERIEAPVI